ncbi:MAG: putative restriction endonuclease [Blastocatellia bacterium]|jgi:hypothetical protein|nr:putative restriction endonuclease [Blastocatellia bacterium]
MKYWCLNFDPTVEDRPAQELPRTHGLSEGFWLMQYQYSHDGFIYQGDSRQISITTRNWRALSSITPGDGCIGYISSSAFRGPTYYAVGIAAQPKARVRHTGAIVHHDTIERTTSEQSHLHSDGVILYDDASAFYEDFTDPWELHQQKQGQTEIYKYAQRIDVQEWLHQCPDGIALTGLSDAAQNKQFIGSAIIEINKNFFDLVSARLAEAL